MDLRNRDNVLFCIQKNYSTHVGIHKKDFFFHGWLNPSINQNICVCCYNICIYRDRRGGGRGGEGQRERDLLLKIKLWMEMG